MKLVRLVGFITKKIIGVSNFLCQL